MQGARRNAAHFCANWFDVFIRIKIRERRPRCCLPSGIFNASVLRRQTKEDSRGFHSAAASL